MKTFEEQWTAWLDGRLAGDELREFEALLPDKAAAESERQSAQKLGALLKRELSPAKLTNEEFFSHQLRERILRETPDPEVEEEEASEPVWWTIRRLFWTGATALAAFLVFAMIVTHEDRNEGQSDLTTSVLNARVDMTTSPDASITPFETKESRVTVLWTEGLKTLPADYAAK